MKQPTISHFAKRTEVSVEQTIVEIKALLTKHHIKRIKTFEDLNHTGDSLFVLAFEHNHKRFRFEIALQSSGEDRKLTRQEEQKIRTHWRCFLLVIKGKLEAVANGIETFEEAFLPYIVMPNNQTVKVHLLPQIDAAYRDHQMPPLLNDF